MYISRRPTVARAYRRRIRKCVYHGRHSRFLLASFTSPPVKLVVILSAFNEVATVAEVVNRIPRTLAGVDTTEVIVVDDGSTDQTVPAARSAGARVISHGKNRGVGVAFRTGIAHALKHGADFIVHLDADGQFNPADITHLLNPLFEERADIATCTRFANGALPKNMPPIKVWGNRRLTALVNWLTGERFTDVSCGFRALTREAALRLTLFGRFTYTQEMFIDAVAKDLRIMEVPLPVRSERAAGSSRVYANAWNYAARSAAILFRSFRDHSPLRVFGSAAATVGGLGVAVAAFVLAHWLRTGQTFPYRSLVVLSGVLILLSAFFATVALLADMLKRQRKLLEELLYHERSRTYDSKARNSQEPRPWSP